MRVVLEMGSTLTSRPTKEWVTYKGIIRRVTKAIDHLGNTVKS